MGVHKLRVHHDEGAFRLDSMEPKGDSNLYERVKKMICPVASTFWRETQFILARAALIGTVRTYCGNTEECNWYGSSNFAQFMWADITPLYPQQTSCYRSHLPATLNIRLCAKFDKKTPL